MKDKLIEKIKELENSLKQSNNKSGDFFESTRLRIEGANSDEEYLEIVDSLKSIGAIVQYGNFSFEQESKLGEVLEIVSEILAEK
jgi:hypothetical protein